MNTTRRNVLQLFGGSAVGMLFTPAPWRLITDTALLTETWPGLPKPARGEIRSKFTNCSLCDAGCPVRARCVGEQPISMAGVGGGLCPFGLTAHQLPFHPARLRQGPVTEAAAAVRSAMAKCGPAEQVAVLDLRPGRTASWTYRRALASLRNGVYLAPPQPAVAVDWKSVATVVSLGAPVLDGWGTPGAVFAARDHFRLIQAEAVESRTASLADQWLPILPGSEEALALALAEELSPSEAAGITGLTADQIRSLLAELKDGGPALVVDREMSPAAVQANVHLGNWGRTVLPRREAPVPETWKKAAPVIEIAKVPERSIRVLLIDESAAGGYLPWEAIERKLVADDPLIVTFGWTANGYGRHSRFVLPAALYPEVLDDVPQAIDAVAPTFRLATPLVAPPAGMASPVDFLEKVTGFTAGDALRERAAAIHQTGAGDLITYADGKTAAIKEVKDDDFWKALNDGARWVDTRPNPRLSEAPQHNRAAIVQANRDAFTVVAESQALPLISPLMSKLYQESRLRLAPNCIALNPADAAACGVEDGGMVSLETAAGRWRVEVMSDSSVRPGVILTAWAEMASASGKVVRI